MEVKIDQFLQVRSHDLVRVHKDDLFQVHWEEHVQKEDLVSPDDPLLFGLSTEP
jgi:hypothetical protein